MRTLARACRSRPLRTAVCLCLLLALADLLLFALARDLQAVHDISPHRGGAADRLVRPSPGDVLARPVGHTPAGPHRIIKVMTYNLNHISRGNDNDPANDPHFPPGSSELTKMRLSLSALLREPRRIERNLEAIVGLIRRESPDIVLLQEADRSMLESGFVDAGRHIAAAAGYPHAVWGAKWSMRCGLEYVTGNAILSRYPIVEAENVPLNPLTWEHFHRKLFGAHTALKATIDIDGEPYTVLNTHLYSKKRNYWKKTEQVRRLLDLVSASPHPVIVGGDYNTSVARLESRRRSSHDPTLPLLDESGVIDMAGLYDEDTLDYVFLRRGDPTSYAGGVKLPPVATDHFINVAYIRLDAASTAAVQLRGSGDA